MSCDDDMARFVAFVAAHPEVTFTILGGGIAVKAERPGKAPVTLTAPRLGELLDTLEAES